jgi:hypothetical protein
MIHKTVVTFSLDILLMVGLVGDDEPTDGALETIAGRHYKRKTA